MKPTEMKALIHDWVDEVWNGGNLDLVPKYMAPEYVMHVQNGSETIEGPAAFRDFAAELRAALPDFHVNLGDILVDGNQCAWRFQCTGTHKGMLWGTPPTGKRVEFGAIVVSRFADNGSWVEDWVVWDAMGIFQQIGVIAPAAAAVA